MVAGLRYLYGTYPEVSKEVAEKLIAEGILHLEDSDIQVLLVSKASAWESRAV